MCALTHGRSFRELVVYQKSRALAEEMFAISQRFPKEETYALTDQVRRSVRSIGAQIAEAWAKRRYEKHFVSKLTDADGEQQETQHLIEIASDCGYLTPVQAESLLQKCAQIGRPLGGMLAKAEMFCNSDSRAVHEEQAPYFTQIDN